MNLYSHKQKWKIALLVIALLLVGVSLFVSNTIVKGVSERERERARQWADAIKKKIELVQLTNGAFSTLRLLERDKMEVWLDATKELSKETPLDIVPDYTLPLKIIHENKDIPVIVLDGKKSISAHNNMDFDTSYFREKNPSSSQQEIVRFFEDSLLTLAELWIAKDQAFTVEVYTDLFMTYVYNDSKGILKLEAERDALINTFNQELIDNQGLIPVLLIDSASNSIIGSNLPTEKLAPNQLKKTIHSLRSSNRPIVIDFQNDKKSILYFDDSPELKQLKYFPYIQFAIIGLFVLIGYIIFSTFRKAEQNQVWAGMAKETAHQLGTPLSSLMAWIQLLEAQQADPTITSEMMKDVVRLDKVTDRFSKIGSVPKMEEHDLNQTVKNVIDYLKPRISDKVNITVLHLSEPSSEHNGPLLEWVIENICKNAVDAMSGKGKLELTIHHTAKWAHIDIKDSGKGISPKKVKTIFDPGYSTKKRGWGLGLTLVKRIVKEYHKGKVFVLESQMEVGSTFRISLPLDH
jgi:two-component system, sporulation sensor kinase D